MQEEIKITSVTVFVNPYTEPDEEEEQDNAKEKNTEDEENVCSRIFEISLVGFFSVPLTSTRFLLTNHVNIFWVTFQDKVGSWYSNPGAGTSEYGGTGVSGGVGKYLKARNAQAESAGTAVAGKKRKVAVSGEFKDFSAW